MRITNRIVALVYIDRTRNLFAWIKCAFNGDENDVYAYYYSNIELAIAAAFGDKLPENSLPAKLMQMAVKSEGFSGDEGSSKEWDETLVGDEIGRRDREQASLGAMGAAQWTGQWMTRPHCEFDDTLTYYVHHNLAMYAFCLMSSMHRSFHPS